MRHRHHGCGPRGRIEINFPEALLAMRGARGGTTSGEEIRHLLTPATGGTSSR